MLERHELEAFVTLAEELHFGRTAARMHVSTARVSQTIKKLEARIGAPLFHRTSRRVELSEAGRRLYDEVAPAWAQIETAVTRAISAGHGGAGPLRAAFTGSPAGQLLVAAGDRMRERDRTAAVEVEVREARRDEVVPWLRERQVDVVLTTVPVDAADVVHGPVLVSEAQVLAVPATHPLARRRSVSAADAAGIAVVSAETPAAALALVGAGRGAVALGAHARRYWTRPDVVYVALADAPLLDWGLVWHRDGASASVRAFARAAAELTG